MINIYLKDKIEGTWHIGFVAFLFKTKSWYFDKTEHVYAVDAKRHVFSSKRDLILSNFEIFLTEQTFPALGENVFTAKERCQAGLKWMVENKHDYPGIIKGMMGIMNHIYVLSISVSPENFDEAQMMYFMLRKFIEEERELLKKNS